MQKKRHILFLSVALLAVGFYASVLIGNMAQGAQQAPVDYVAETDLIVVGPLPQSGAAAKDYQALVADAAYHAAFAMGQDGRYGWSDNYATQAAADQSALDWCRRDGQGCQIVARIAPQKTVEIDGQPLSRTAAEAATDYQARSGAKAFALSDMGDWGAAWNYKTRAGAIARAMQSCSENLTNDRPGGPPEGACRLVWSD